MKITYENKVNVTTSSLPRKNKIIDADMNEIKNVVNKNAGDLLWTNSNPTNGMSEGTTISLDLSTYQSVKIIFKVDADTTTMATSRYIEREIEVGYRTSVDHVTPYTNQAMVDIRQRTFVVDETGLTLENGYKHTIGNTNLMAIDTKALIPYKIYGVG